ncbi:MULTISPECIES: serine/threonine-protein kinase [unclassified Micromonospora]|uniref:serine/threonine-protein kinase n=1 Tax=unclassified Micromonospora TaxID=2617518 RepID=UPI001C247E5A|nr:MULTISPECIES: serine/threonine-protein kinase [unclassified Micromonospora]MBU8855905.1 protein kinase [Micromonospora sp. WMMB482]MDM4781509.1 protein kinase [Micromonospora sp. b486]
MREVVIAGRYRLLELVGRGGMGQVWRARDEELQREVAVKQVVPPNWLAETEQDELRARTLREARTAARLNHPNVVRVYDVVRVQGEPWLIMEYVPSRSLQEIIETDGPLPPGRAAEIGLSVLAALRAAHDAGVLHRDVKPANVLLARDGRVLLTDFGLAVFQGGDGAMTRPGLVLGSPQYVAPERAAEGVSSVEADMWSLGATLHAAVEGRSPYARSTAMATLAALATRPPDPAPHAGPLTPVLAGLLRRDPRTRLGHRETARLLGVAAVSEADAEAAGSAGRATAAPSDRPAGGRDADVPAGDEPGSPAAAGGIYPDLMPPAAAARAWSRAAKRNEWAPPAEGDRAPPSGDTAGAAGPTRVPGPAPSGTAGRSVPATHAVAGNQSSPAYRSGAVGPVDADGSSSPTGRSDATRRPDASGGSGAVGGSGVIGDPAAGGGPKAGGGATAAAGSAGLGGSGPVSLGPTVLTSFVDPGSPAGPESAPRADALSPVHIAGPGAAPVTKPPPVAHSGPIDSGAVHPAPPRPAGVPRPADPPLTSGDGNPLHRWGLMLGAVVLALATGVGTALAITGGRDETPQTGGSTEAVARPWDRPPGPGVPPPPFPCVRPDVAGTPVRKGPPPDDPPVTVPTGWVWPADTGGFRIALPAGWLQLRSGDTTCFQDPQTRRILGVEPYPGGDPVGRLKSSERDLTSAGRLPHYQKVRLKSDGPGAVWECRWTAPYGERMRALRVLPGERAGWTLGWTTSDADWPAASKQFAVIRASLGTVRPTRTAG